MQLMPPDDRPLPRDPTPVVGAQTDIAPLGREGAKPPHERTADEDADVVNWQGIAESNEFKELLRAKRRFIVPATIFFIVYYFLLPYLVGYHTRFMQRKVWGEMNLAYLFALSQFFMAWILAALYVAAAAGWDRKARALIEQTRG
jgi:uncharacterized membrane protein (DUF485 family)